MSDSTNPYAAPPAVADALPVEDKYARVGRVMVMWEKLRLLYNAILGVVTVGVAALVVLSRLHYRPSLAQIVMGAILANVLFCAGHAVDGYLSWFGIRWRVVTWGLFCLGTLFASALAAMVVLGFFRPMFDDF